MRKPKKSINLWFDLLELRGDQTYVIRLTGRQIKILYLVSSYHINSPQDPKKYTNKKFASCQFSVKTLLVLFACCCSAKSVRVWAWQNNVYASALLLAELYITSPKKNICTIIQSETCKDNPMGIIYKFSSISTETLLTSRTIYTNGVIWKRKV